MLNKKIKILVAYHKDDIFPLEDVYFPIHVGKSISSIDLGIQGDDDGENISNKNPFYCELTAIYWAWKNIKADYYGLCHYRRYISFSSNKYSSSLSEHDNGCVPEKYLDGENVIEKYGLDPKTMSETIKEYDLIAIPSPAHIRHLYKAWKPSHNPQRCSRLSLHTLPAPAPLPILVSFRCFLSVDAPIGFKFPHRRQNRCRRW